MGFLHAVAIVILPRVAVDGTGMHRVGRRIVREITAGFLAPEVLPFITGHDVDMVLQLVFEVVIVLRIGVEEQIALQQPLETGGAEVKVQRGGWSHVGILLAR